MRVARIFFFLVLITWPLLAETATQKDVAHDEDVARWVDPFIGTGGHGHTYPGPTRPFGMVQLSPDTRLEGWDGCSGYHYSDNVIYGFSHTHLSGTGVSDYADILLMPSAGEITLGNGYEEKDPDQGYASRFNKSTERAEAGYYAVELADTGIGVELTTTLRAGFHRYTFPQDVQTPHVIVDLRHRDLLLDFDLDIVGDREVVGFRRSSAWAEDQIVYFVARFSKPFRLAQRNNVIAALEFEDGGELLVKVGISAVDIDGARRNLDAEIPGWDFDAVRQTAYKEWNESLSRLQIEGATDEQKTNFYTALYHSLIAPNLFSDVDRRYRGMDRAIHKTDSRHYTVFSLWDTFRATHPLFTLLERERTAEFVRAFLAMYEQGGRLPVWELAGNETDCMIGYHSVSVITEAWQKGIRDFDAELAFTAMRDSAEMDHFGLKAYKEQGFIGSRDDSESVSKTLEYAYDDFCIGSFAKALGHDEQARIYQRRSQAWRHLLDPETNFMRARRNQRWLTPFEPQRVDTNYTEANSWQYSFFVPQDIASLKESLGGDEAFIDSLEALFNADSETSGRDQADITGLIGQYAHGNEPSHHMAWLYHYAGRPDKSTERVHQILEELYTPTPDGLAGNEDCGQMSSWYILSSMGLYPVCPCSPEYVIGPPLFDKASMAFEDGKNFAISKTGEGRYVQSAALNGAPLTRSFLSHDEIIAGGELVLKMGAKPSTWGTAPADRPPSPGRSDERVLAAPYAIADRDVFRGSLDVELAAEPGARVLYAADGEEELQPYEDALVLEQSTRLRFQAEKNGIKSPEVTAYFHRIPHDWDVALTWDPDPMYTAGGAEALLDGQQGPANWRIGGWLGYQEGAFEATVDLGEIRSIRRAGAGFLQDINSWIWMPTSVTVAVSDDGETFQEVASLGHNVAINDWSVERHELVANLSNIRGRYVRVRAERLPEIPDWHLGHGGDAWVFVDEMIVFDDIAVE